MMKKIAVFGAVSAALLSWSLPSQAGAVLDAVKSRGFVQCGVNTSAPGFASADSQGNGRGSTSTSAAPWRPPFWAIPRR